LTFYAYAFPKFESRLSPTSSSKPEHQVMASQNPEDTTSQASETALTGSSFLDIFPSEIRNEIYKCLLCSPILADASAITVQDHEHAPSTLRFPNYNISPAILRTCRQIYEEAIVILYEHNTFYFVSHIPRSSTCCDRCHPNNGPMLCPLTRWYPDLTGGCRMEVDGVFTNLGSIHGLNKIRHWKICLNACDFLGKCSDCFTIVTPLSKLNP